MKKQRNKRKKSNENLQKRRFPAYFRYFRPEKNFSQKIGLRHALSIANTHLCAKNQKKLMMKSRENVQKPVFPAYFRYFLPEKSFYKIGLRQFLGIAISNQCAKFYEQI